MNTKEIIRMAEREDNILTNSILLKMHDRGTFRMANEDKKTVVSIRPIAAESDEVSIPERLKKLRAARALTPAAMAAIARCSKVAYCKMESGRQKIMSYHLRNIAVGLGVSGDSLLWGE